MAIEHVNRRGDRYYLHEGKTRTGKPHFFFSRKREGTLAAVVPRGYEIYESPGAQVFLRKVVPRVVTDAEVAAVERGVRELAELDRFLIDVKGPSIVVHLPPDDDFDDLVKLASPGLRQDPAEFRRLLQSLVNYHPMMRFTLVDDQARRFSVDRWCFKGRIDGWFPLACGRDLESQVAQYCPHLGQESFYELM